MFDESVKTAVDMYIVHGHWLLRTITISAHDLENENANRLINYPIYIPGICFSTLISLFSNAFKLGKRPLLKGKIYLNYSNNSINNSNRKWLYKCYALLLNFCSYMRKRFVKPLQCLNNLTVLQHAKVNCHIL